VSDQQFERILERITAYDGTEEQFQALVADALALVPERPPLADLRKELARRCKIAVSTPGSWARGSRIPGGNVRKHDLGKLKEILEERRP
jgi:hypothetical protein